MVSWRDNDYMGNGVEWRDQEYQGNGTRSYKKARKNVRGNGVVWRDVDYQGQGVQWQERDYQGNGKYGRPAPRAKRGGESYCSGYEDGGAKRKRRKIPPSAAQKRARNNAKKAMAYSLDHGVTLQEAWDDLRKVQGNGVRRKRRY